MPERPDLPARGPGDPRPVPIGVQHTGYPQDGFLRWVRWIDKVEVAGGGTGSPHVHVLLSLPLDGADPARPPTPAQTLLAGRGDAGMLVRVHVGDMPALSPGLLVRDGKRVGWLDMEERTFAFDRNTASDPLACRRGSPAERPAFWKAGIPWNVLPASKYPLGHVLEQARCIVVHDGVHQLVLPCSEVFRFFYAPETLAADVLLRAPFDLVKDKLLNSEWTGPRPDGSFQVGLRSGLTGRSAASLANLVLGGRAAAERLRRMMVPGAVTASDAVDAGMIEAAIPYDWTHMRIKVRGVQLYPELRRSGALDKFLAMVIVGVVWPVPPVGVPKQVHYRLDNFNTERGEGDTPPHLPHPAGARSLPAATQGGDLEETADDPSGIGTEATFVEVLAALVEGGPEVFRMPLEAGRMPCRSKVIKTSGTADRVSAADQQRGSAGVGALRHVQAEPDAEDEASVVRSRFAALAARLEELRTVSLIESWAPVDPGPAMRAVREGMPVWPFPGVDAETKRKLRWSNLLPGVYRARTALVVAISVGGRMAYWLEVELRPDEAGYRSVVFTTEEPVVAVVPFVLLMVARAGGMAPPSGIPAAPAGVSAMVRRRHGPDDDPFGRRRILDGVSAAVALSPASAS